MKVAAQQAMDNVRPASHRKLPVKDRYVGLKRSFVFTDCLFYIAGNLNDDN